MDTSIPISQPAQPPTLTHINVHTCGIHYGCERTHFHISVPADVFGFVFFFTSTVGKDFLDKFIYREQKTRHQKDVEWGRGDRMESSKEEINPLQCSIRLSLSSAGRTDSQPRSGEGQVWHVRKWSWTEKRVVRSTQHLVWDNTHSLSFSFHFSQSHTHTHRHAYRHTHIHTQALCLIEQQQQSAFPMAGCNRMAGLSDGFWVRGSISTTAINTHTLRHTYYSHVHNTQVFAERVLCTKD